MDDLDALLARLMDPHGLNTITQVGMQASATDHRQYILTNSERDALVRMVEDARRYRWLRSQHWNESTLCVVADPINSVKLGSYCPSEHLLDEAINAAMAAHSWKVG